MSASLPLWSSPPEILELGCNEVHVWRAALDLPISHVRSLEQTLAADERRLRLCGCSRGGGTSQFSTVLAMARGRECAGISTDL